MGNILSFAKNNENRTLNQLIVEHYPTFRQRYLKAERKSWEKYNEAFGEQSVVDFLQKNPQFNPDLNTINAYLYQQLVLEFAFSSWGNTNTSLTCFASCVKIWRYQNSEPVIEATHDPDFIRLWRYLIEPRLLKQTHNDEYDGAYECTLHLGYLNRAEYLLLKQKIEHYFGDIEAINQKVAQAEQQREQYLTHCELRERCLFDIPPTNEFEGLQNMWYALNELTADNAELITCIEIG